MANESKAAEDPRSKAEVDVHDKASVQRWAQALGLTDEALQAAVGAVGPRVDRIKDYLAGGMAGQQQDG